MQITDIRIRKIEKEVNSMHTYTYKTDGLKSIICKECEVDEDQSGEDWAARNLHHAYPEGHGGDAQGAFHQVRIHGFDPFVPTVHR